MNAFDQLRLLHTVTLALLFAPAVMPPLQPYAWRIRIAAVVLYFAAGLAIFLRWRLGG